MLVILLQKMPRCGNFVPDILRVSIFAKLCSASGIILKMLAAHFYLKFDIGLPVYGVVPFSGSYLGIKSSA